MDGHGAAGAACIPPQNKQRVTRCRRHCVTSRGEAWCRFPWCEQVRRGSLRIKHPYLISVAAAPRGGGAAAGRQSFQFSFGRTWRMR
eukprot:gene9810-biopygen1715